MTTLRAGLLVLFLAGAAYANSLGNGFAYDDEGIIVNNPRVAAGDWRGAAGGAWWPGAMEGGGLYRPLTSLSFTLEWGAFGGSPLGFHALNVLAHALVSLLLFLLLLRLAPLAGALAGAAVFAIHPVHTEAVANVVGRAELYAALFFLLGCLLYWKGREWTGVSRHLRLLGLGGLYFLSLAGKEMGVTLPGAFLLLELFAPSLTGGEEPPLRRRLAREGPVFLLLGVVLLAYLGLRVLALGTVAGEVPAPVFLVVGPEARALTSFALWLQYLRLLLFPLELASDYDPGVLFPSEGVDPPAVAGAAALVLLVAAAFRSRRKAPLLSLGIAWFALCVLPVSNLLFSTGVLLAERTLYLPSAGLSLVVAGLTAPALALRAPLRPIVLGLALLAGMALFTRTVLRNPAWMSTFVLHQTLHEEHPGSWRAIRARAHGLERVGEAGAAAEALDLAVALAPADYTLLVQAGDFHGRLGSWTRSEDYLRRAVELAPGVANAYQLLAGHLIRRGWGREGHRVALEGLARAGPGRELWALVSESYILKGDLPAAARAREAALGADPSWARDWSRLGEILEALGDAPGAAAARARAEELERTGEGAGRRSR